MRQLQAHRHGEPGEVIELAETRDEPLEANEVRITCDAVGLNFLDVMRCRGTYPSASEPPMTFGVEVAGQVVEAGAAVRQLDGAEVLACPTLPRGALGDRVVVAARLTRTRPADVDPVAAAAIPVNYQTAWFALRRAGMRAGSTTLVTAAAGGVGIATTQLAAALGSRVIAAAGGPDKTGLCASQGAEVVIDYRSDDLTDAVLAATAGAGVDVVVDPVGGTVFHQALAALAFEGVLVAVGSAGGSIPPVDPMTLAARNVSVVGLSWGSSYPIRHPSDVDDAYRRLFELYRQGQVRPVVSGVVGLADAPAALASLADRTSYGKLIVRPSLH